MNFQEKIVEIKSILFHEPNKVLSVYLNTQHNGQEKWKIELKNGLKEIEEDIDKRNEMEMAQFTTIRRKVESYFDSIKREIPRSVILFASIQDNYFETFELQVPVETMIYWKKKPIAGPLEILSKQYPRTTFVLFQQNKAKILKTVLGKLIEIELFEYDLDTEDWTRYEGPISQEISAVSHGGKASQQDTFKERVNYNTFRWWREFSRKLDKKALDENWERIILVGEKEITGILQENMNVKIYQTIQKNLFHEKKEQNLVEKLMKLEEVKVN